MDQENTSKGLMNGTLSSTKVQWSKLGVRGLGLAGAVLLATGCPNSPPSSQQTSSPNAAGAQASGKRVVVRGSNTVGEELAPRWIAEFKKDHPDITFDTEFKGTAYGVGNLLGGYCDLAGASKPMAKEHEEIARTRGIQVKEYILGSYAVAVVVNAANPVSTLASNQVAALFTGGLSNWKEVGGPDAPVQLYIRDPVSGTHIGFKELAMGDKPYAPGARLLTNYQAIAESVAKDPNGLGYVGIGLDKHQGIKPLAIDGVQPTYDNINQKKYAYARTLRFYSDAQKESSETTLFIKFILSDRGQTILKELGNAPKP
jgi:phosphate transport system substrate-binding protein